MRIALAQLNPTVGDFRSNVDSIARTARQAAERGAEVVAFPELSLPGYPPRDLVERSSFLDRNEEELLKQVSSFYDLLQLPQIWISASSAGTPAAHSARSASGP